MVSSSELTQTTSPEITERSLRLLSVNEAREILKVRHETVKKLIQEGKIEVLLIGKRIKIPYRSLIKFLNNNAKELSEESCGQQLHLKRDIVENKIDSIIKQHTRRY